MRMPRLSRRSFIGVASVGGLATAALSVLPGCSHRANEGGAGDPVVVDASSATDILESFTSTDLTLKERSSWSLPLGTVLRSAEGVWIPATVAGSSATPMVKGCALSSESGQLVEVVSQPLGTAPSVEIFEVGCSDEVYAWVELDLSSRDWTLYASRFGAGQRQGEPTTLWNGTVDYDPARFVVSGTTVVWIVQPSTKGTKTKDSSYAYVWHVGDTNAKSAVESPGRFATAPAVSGGAVILTPRVLASKGTYYGVIAYSLHDDLATIVDQMVMPQSVRPFRATRVGDKFLISVEASYNSGGLLGQMGTYIGTPSAGFACLSREPSECGAGRGSRFLIKSTSSYFVIDLEAKTYAILPSADRSLDYGEYPARMGECELFVTFATVKNADTGYPAGVHVRTFGI